MMDGHQDGWTPEEYLDIPVMDGHHLMMVGHPMSVDEGL